MKIPATVLKFDQRYQNTLTLHAGFAQDNQNCLKINDINDAGCNFLYYLHLIIYYKPKSRNQKSTF